MNNPPAFPLAIDWGDAVKYQEGMTLLQYAAIKLKVPSSGNEELDAMIKESLRNDFAAKAMQSWITVTVQRYVHQSQLQIDMPSRDLIAAEAYQIADAMLKAREE